MVTGLPGCSGRDWCRPPATLESLSGAPATAGSASSLPLQNVMPQQYCSGNWPGYTFSQGQRTPTVLQHVPLQVADLGIPHIAVGIGQYNGSRYWANPGIWLAGSSSP